MQDLIGVGIDVSKNKSTVAIQQPGGVFIRKPFDVKHTKAEIAKLTDQLNGCHGSVRVVMEATGHYHEPIAHALLDDGFFVSVVNPKLIKDFHVDDSLRNVKSDKADARKISSYALAHWSKLSQYGDMDEKREQLKYLNRQFDFYTKVKTRLNNNLISILDETYPEVNTFFSSPARQDGHQKWVDFASDYWHVDCVREMDQKAFADQYTAWLKEHKYQNRQGQADKIYEASKDLIAVLPKDEITKKLVEDSVTVLNTVSETLESIRDKMNELASTFPEYPVVMQMNGVGPSLGPQLMAEIGDVTRFKGRSAITAFAGVDPGVNQSGGFNQKSVPVSKKGSPLLRCTLYKIMEILLKNGMEDDAVYRFMRKKRDEGKPYYVYMTAGANKFLRIYYGRVREYLNGLDDSKKSTEN